MRHFSRVLLLLITGLGICYTGSQAQGNDIESRKKFNSEMLDMMAESKSLRWNAQQMNSYSQYEGDDVVPRLLDIYRKPPELFEHNVRYLAASFVLKRHDIPEGSGMNLNWRRDTSESDVKALRKFFKDHQRRSEHLWGVYCAACVLALEHDFDIDMEILELAGNRRAPEVNRAAALIALSRAGSDLVRRALEVMLEHEFEDSAEDAVLFEAICWAAARAYRPLHKEGEPLRTAWRKVFNAIADSLENEDLMNRSVREASLALQFCFQTKHPYQYAIMWRTLYDTGKDPKRDEGNTFASFMGLDVMGDRIVFLIDASDSMLNPLKEDEIESVKGPITGEGRGGKKDRDAYEIDWSKVENRFDAAREHVKWTLSRLDKDKSVVVVLFGDDAEPLAITDGFVSTKKSTVKKIHAALDAIRPNEAPANMQTRRPYGVLMGETNYYRALLTAFRSTRRGVATAPREHYGLEFITEGADAIFILSDGAPIRDGFTGSTPTIDREVDSYRLYDTKQSGEGEWVDFPGRPATEEREVESRDPETGAVTKRKIPGRPAVPPTRKWRKKETLRYTYDWFDDNGPYATDSGGGYFNSFELGNLTDEVRRMNLVRRCRIHAIGIGEAQMNWLKPIAKAGGGKAVYFGPEGETDAKRRGFPDFPGFPSDD